MAAVKYDFLNRRESPKGLARNIYLLGTSEDGPIMEPIHVKSKEKARAIFGDENQGTLVKVFDEAYDSGKEISIFLMRITGKSATFEVGGIHPETGELETLLLAQSIYGGTKYNEISFSFEYDVEQEISCFVIHTENEKIYYPMTTDMNLLEFSKIINEDCRKKIHPVMISVIDYDIPFYSIAGMLDGASLADGEDGIDASRDELFFNCDTAYTLLLGKAVDVIVPVDMYMDDVNPSFLYGEATYGDSFYSNRKDYLQLIDTYRNDRVVTYHEQLIDFCRQQAELGYMSHGVIGLRPLSVVPKNIEEDDSYILRIVNATAFRDRHGFVEYEKGYWLDKGFYASVVAMDLVFHKGTDKEYVSNGAVRYGTLIAGHYDTTTNSSLGDDVHLRYELSAKTRNQLADIGLVTCRDSVRHGIVVHSGITASVSQNELHSIANTRMVQVAIAFINEAVELLYESDFVSEMRRVYLEEMIKARLKVLAENNVIIDYAYDIRYLSDDSRGEIILQLETKYTVDGIVAYANISSEVMQ